VSDNVLKLYFDFYCPYCYMAWELLFKALKNRDIPMQLHGIGLNPPGNPLMHNRGIWSDQRWEQIKKQSEKLGLFVRKPQFMENSIIPTRGLSKYRGLGLREYVSGVFKAIFREGIDLAKSHSLIDFLQSDGVDVKPLNEALSDPATLEKVKEDTLLWGHDRIRMIPTFQVGDERYAGLVDERGLDNFINLMVF